MTTQEDITDLRNYFETKYDYNLSISEVEEQKNDIDWSNFSRRCSLLILENFQNKIKWDEASSNRNLTFELVKKYINKIDTCIVVQHCNFDMALQIYDLVKDSPKFNINHFMNSVSCNPNITIEFVREHKDLLSWRYLSNTAGTQILIEFEDRLDWEVVSYNKNLSVDLILSNEYNPDYREVDFREISRWAGLEIIKEFPHHVDYNMISKYGSNDVLMNLDYTLLNFEYVSNNKNIKIELIEKYKDRMNYTNNVKAVLFDSLFQK